MLEAFVFTAIVGGIYSVLVLMFRYRYTKDLLSRFTTMLKLSAYAGQFIYIPASENEEKPKVSYGIAIALGTLYKKG